MEKIHRHSGLVSMLLTILFCSPAKAQAPLAIPYQAVARNNSGAILANQTIRVRFSIRDSIATGSILYRETFAPTTTAQGVFNVNVGTGTVAIGSFNSINWGHNNKFMQVELDPTGGSSYVDMGTQQMMSVPYALYAGTTASGHTFLNRTGLNTSWNFGTSGLQTIPHGLGVVPQRVTIKAGTHPSVSNYMSSNGTYDGTNQNCMHELIKFSYVDASYVVGDSTRIVHLDDAYGHYSRATITVDSANIYLNWDSYSDASSVIYNSWTVEAVH